MALRRHLPGVPDESGLGDYRDDAKGVLAFLLGLVGPGNSRSSYNSLWYARGPGGIGNRNSDCASWTLPPSYSAT